MTPLSTIAGASEKRLVAVDRLLAGTYRASARDLGNVADPLLEAVYIILTYQTDLPRAQAAFRRLTGRFPSPDLIAQASPSAFAATIREAGLHRQKARTIKKLLQTTKRAFGRYTLDPLRSWSTQQAERFLLTLPGMSVKGARCVLLYGLRRQVLPIDSNSYRIFRRLGILRSEIPYRRRTVHDALQLAVPAIARRRLHINLVVHGQRTCVPMTPRCPDCALLRVCRRVGVQPRVRI